MRGERREEGERRERRTCWAGPYLGQSAVLCERQRDGLATGGFVQTQVHAGAHVPGAGRGWLVWAEGSGDGRAGGERWSGGCCPGG